MIRVGLVGLGFMGVTHAKAWSKIPEARIVAICDAFNLPADGVLRSAGNVGDGEPVRLDLTQVKAYRQLDEVLANPDVDVVDLCVPTADHSRQSIAALRAGKHVVCEKPLARTPALCRPIVEAAEAARTYFLPAMCMRFWPGWAWLKRVLDEGTYGRALVARFRRVAEPPGWSRGTYLKGEESGGALLDLHIHDTDFVQFCFGRPRSVFSTGLSRLSGAIDHVHTQYQVVSGAVVSAEGSWLMSQGHGFRMAYTVTFESATADFDLARGAEALQLFENGQPPRFVPLEGPDGYEGELRHLVEAIQSGTPPRVVTARDALSAVEICEAEERSVVLRRPVEL